MSVSKKRGSPAQKSFSKLYIGLGIVVVVLVAALILWNHGLFRKSTNTTAVVIGEQSFDVATVEYYYYQAYSNNASMANYYTQMGMSSGYDPQKSPADQMYNEELGQTYADYFRETALIDLQKTAILVDMAKKDNYELSEKGKETVDTQMKEIDSTIMQYQVTKSGSESYYFKLFFGDHMTRSLLRDIITDNVLASDYATWRSEQFTYDDATVSEYYNSHAADLDSYDYKYCLIPSETETGTDKDGNPIEATEEQTAEAMKVSKETAEAMASRIRAGEDFNTVAKDYVDENSKDLFSDPKYNLVVDSLGSSLTSVYGTWLKEDGRTPNEVGTVEQEGSGTYVIQFLAREKRDNSYQTVDIRSISLLSETSKTTNEDGTETEAPSEEQLAAARAQAEEIVAKWDATTEKTADTFLNLAPEKSSSKQKDIAETLPDVPRNKYGSEFDAWAFTPDVQIGNTAIVEMTDNNGAVIGYRVVYMEEFGQVRWEYETLTALRNADYEEWFSALIDQYPIAKQDGFSNVGHAPSSSSPPSTEDKNTENLIEPSQENSGSATIPEETAPSEEAE